MKSSIVLSRLLVASGVVAALSTLLAPAVAAPPKYRVIDLGTFGGRFSYAYGINNLGQVVGEATYSNNTSHAFLYDGSGLQDLGTLGGSRSTASGINDSGQIVGTARTAGGQRRAFLYEGGSMIDLGLGDSSSASAINASGQIVGSTASSAFLYDSGNVTSPFSGEPTAINASGQIVGQSGSTAFFYSGGVQTNLGTLGGSLSAGMAINDAGLIAGTSLTGPLTPRDHVFLSDNGGPLQDIGTLGGDQSYAFGINNLGQVVGDSDITGNTADHAFLYSSGAMWDLNDLILPGSGLELTNAFDINDRGEIVGYGNIGRETHAFLLTISAPEPTTLGLLAFAGLPLLRKRRRN